MVCPACGSQPQDGSQFCPKCGGSLVVGAPAAPEKPFWSKLAKGIAWSVVILLIGNGLAYWVRQLENGKADASASSPTNTASPSPTLAATTPNRTESSAPTEPNPSSSWKVSVETDKLNDKRVVTAAVAVAHSSELTYELSLKCDGTDKWPNALIAAFDASSPLEHHARLIEWDTRTPISDFLQRQGVTLTVKDFRYRVDEREAENGSLTRRYGNGGETFSLFKTGLPETRLVIADIFPDETVEFPFDKLTPEQRSTLQSMCFAESNDVPTSGH